LKDKLAENQDEFQFVCNNWWSPHDIKRHPEIIQLAEHLGYSPLNFDEEKLRKRYLEGVINHR